MKRMWGGRESEKGYRARTEGEVVGSSSSRQ